MFLEVYEFLIGEDDNVSVIMEFYYPLQMTEDSNTMMKEMKVGANTKMVAKGHTGVKMLVFILILTDIFSIFRS